MKDNKDINIGDMIWMKEAAYQYHKNFKQIPFDDVVEYGYVTRVRRKLLHGSVMNIDRIQGVEAMFFGREEHGRAYLDYSLRGTTWDKIR